MRITAISRIDDDEGSQLECPRLLLPKERTTDKAQVLLTQIRESNSDLLCHCCHPPARMFIRYSHNHFHIVNHAILGKHSEECPLYTHIKGSIEKGATADVIAEHTESFSLHGNLKTTSTESNLSPKPLPHSPCSPEERQVREPKITQLIRYLTKETFANWYYPNKKMSSQQTLIKFKQKAKDVRFGKTTLDRYLFFGHNGFKYALSTLNRDIKNDSWEGPGRPHGLVLFITDTLHIKGKYAYFDGLSYGFKNTRCHKALENSGPYLVALSLAQDEYTQTPSQKIKPTSLYIQPIASMTDVFPVESDEERFIFQSFKKQIDARDYAKWSLQKVMLPKFILASVDGATSPDYLLQQKNTKNKVCYRCLVCLDGPSHDSKQPVSLNTWRANERITLNTKDFDSDILRFFEG